MTAGKAKSRHQSGTPIQRVDVTGLVDRAVTAMVADMVKMLQPTDEIASIAGRLMSHNDPDVRRLAAFTLSRDLTPGKQDG